MNTVKLEGIAEIDETNAYISYSGNFKKQNTNKWYYVKKKCQLK